MRFPMVFQTNYDAETHPFVKRLKKEVMGGEDFISVTVVCPDANKLVFKIKPDIPMVRLMNVFTRRECLENVDHLVFYHKGMKIRALDTPMSLNLSNGDTIKTHIPQEHDQYDSDCVFVTS